MNRKINSIHLTSLTKTKKLADAIAGYIKNNDCLAIKGDVGVGKTTFTSFLIKKITNSPNLVITSPTFTIINQYNYNNKQIWHCDLYRLHDYNDLVNIGILEPPKNTILIIEWPDLILQYMAKQPLLLCIDNIAAKKRVVNIYSIEEKWQQLSKLKI
ncbi:tRNA threonylcarbamoyladenosine biosynthesis protein TsaE [Candidatus Xenohaliotis californiensis]|uniref:tRNA threonylcarbamoyladenosine biosynthesis protein TsaE n=1 Tax=Candidatus Xenohaliotis californiensis TaxID=84677 RepID=A0ABM9N839_9RICK|nr:tRNA threonylcarbamoyladenosine biosynthesis protein TsaE [Candidatus Xenohaliotis californiensis]